MWFMMRTLAGMVSEKLRRNWIKKVSIERARVKWSTDVCVRACVRPFKWPHPFQASRPGRKKANLYILDHEICWSSFVFMMILKVIVVQHTPLQPAANSKRATSYVYIYAGLCGWLMGDVAGGSCSFGRSVKCPHSRARAYRGIKPFLDHIRSSDWCYLCEELSSGSSSSSRGALPRESLVRRVDVCDGVYGYGGCCCGAVRAYPPLADLSASVRAAHASSPRPVIRVNKYI